MLGLVSAFGLAVADVVAPGTEAEIRERTQPVGQLCRAGESCDGLAGVADVAAAAGMSGEQVYNTFCFACHATGVSESPLLGDAEAWAPRIAKGLDMLMTNTLNGFNIMPPKGTCMACSDAELQAAIDYMIAGLQ
jgi:cytochrome c5